MFLKVGWLQKRRQKGVALITVMLVVAVATAISTLMMVREQRAIARTSSMLNGSQTEQYNFASEDFAMELLAEDARNDASSGHGAVDSLFELWATQWPPFPVNGGTVRARITDEQGLFNLNDLITDNGQPDPNFTAVFQNILQSLQLPPGLLPAIIDWLDPDNDPQGPMGAESDWYLHQNPPYRAANTFMASVSELRLIRGMTPQYYARLSPLLTVLPRGTLININTIDPRLLAAMIPGLSPEQAASIQAAGAPTGYQRTDAFLSQPSIAVLPQAQLDQLAAVLTINSSYFRVTSQVDIDQHRTVLRSVIKRSSANSLQVVSREHILPMLQAATDSVTTKPSDISAENMQSMENAFNAPVSTTKPTQHP